MSPRSGISRLPAVWRRAPAMADSVCMRSKRLAWRAIRRWSASSLELASDIHPHVVVAPFGGRILFLEMIGAQDQVARGKQPLSYLGILLHLGVHRGDNQFVMLALFHRPVLHALALEGHPVDIHLLHVLVACSSGVLSVPGSHLRHLFPSVRQRNTDEAR